MDTCRWSGIAFPVLFYKILTCFLFALSISLFSVCSVFAKDANDVKTPPKNLPVLVLNSTFGPPISTPMQTGFADRVVAEGLHRIGYQLETVHLPAERALINANRGIEDGDITRVAGLQKKYTNLIQVPESILSLDMVLFTKNKSNFKLNGWGSVASHSLAIISGWKIMENNFGKYADNIEIIKTDNAAQSFLLLVKDRVDFVAYSKWSGLSYLRSNNIKNVTLLQPPLASPEFYVYLHKKHKRLILKLAEAIANMKADGSYQKLFDELLKPYLNRSLSKNFNKSFNKSLKE